MRCAIGDKHPASCFLAQRPLSNTYTQQTQSFLSFRVNTFAVPAIVIHSNKIQPRFAAFIEFDFAANRRLPQELACLEILEDNSSSPDVLHGVADWLQVPLGGPCVCVGLIVHVVVHQTHLSLLSTCSKDGGDGVSAQSLFLEWMVGGRACGGAGQRHMSVGGGGAKHVTVGLGGGGRLRRGRPD